VNEAGLPAGISFHDLRHTGNHLAAISYQHATAQRGREMADRLNKLVEGEIKAMSEGKPDDDDGSAGMLLPTA
jgi:hypothetical protein